MEDSLEDGQSAEGKGSEMDVDENDGSTVDADDGEDSSYIYSDDGEECRFNEAPAAFISVQDGRGDSRGSASKQKLDISVLDGILSKCNEAFPEAVHVEDESFLRLVTAQQASPSAAKKKETPKCKEKVRVEKVVHDTRIGKMFRAKHRYSEEYDRSSSFKTSTGKSGVGYETGHSGTSSQALKDEMNQAHKRQEALDAKCCNFMKSITSFLEGLEGGEGIVLLALKMSPGFNRMIFSLFKNDSLMEWGKRREVYIAALELVEQLSTSKFLSSFLLHDLLEGDGSLLKSGSSNCQTLLSSLHHQADAMKRNQELLLQKNESDNPQEVGLIKAETCTDGKKLTPEEYLARDLIDVCDKINQSYQKCVDAIKLGREAGTISEEYDDSALTNEDEKKKTSNEKECIAAYNREMQQHRLNYVPLVDAVNNKEAKHFYFAEKDGQGKATISTIPKPAPQRRMLRITSEISGLAADLPVHWASGVFVRVDEERPDLMKAVIMAPEDTPYENGVFEFDIFLPLSYPNDSPKVHLITTGKDTIRFNPNLYRDGKVCLSLLGTWSGPSWIPDKSTLLQVLVSIQSLILVQDPYFNEPGNDSSDATQRAQSKQYDRQIRAATLKAAILGQMKTPTPLFEDCINNHFRLKKHRILKQLKEWEELENAAEAAQGNSPPPRGNFSNALVAGGGIQSNSNVVAALCEEIRKLLNAKWPDPKTDGD